MLAAVIADLIAVVISLVVVGVVIYSFFPRRHGENVVGTTNLVPTDEIFRDPTTNRLMRVYVDPSTGKRTYIPEKKLDTDI